MKATLEYNLPEEMEQYESSINGAKYKYMVEAIWQNVFRPYHKHGYSDVELNNLLDSECGKYIMNTLEEYYKSSIQDII